MTKTPRDILLWFDHSESSTHTTRPKIKVVDKICYIYTIVMYRILTFVLLVDFVMIFVITVSKKKRPALLL